tara:strand:- start:1063 stop:1524 length:462 start_codon:yes stop_codon:yes gene_type:complete
MARITVEDCIKKIDSQYDLVMLAKERTSQLNAGEPSLVEKDNDKNTVIALREIGDGKVSIKTLEDAAINRLRKQQDDTSELEDLEDTTEDSFDKIYKGEISKSGTAILPSKRVRRMPEKINFDSKKTEEKDVKKEEKIDQPEENVSTDKPTQE